MSLVCLAVAALAAAALASPPPSQATTGPCTAAAAVPVTHVVVIVMENRNTTSVIGSPDAPYINGLSTGCGQAVDYHGIRHPSLPNYLAMTGGDTFGVTDDKAPKAHLLTGSSIFGQVGSTRWRSYQESMPTPCLKYTPTGSLYAVKHNPAAYFTSLTTCTTNDLPLGPYPTFDAAFTLVSPNIVNDMHDGTVRQGDDWMAGFVPKVLASPEYRAGTLALFIVWDENDGPRHAASNQVPMIVVAPSVAPGTIATGVLDHYSLLATWEDMLGLPRLAYAVTASSMTTTFRLPSRRP